MPPLTPFYTTADGFTTGHVLYGSNGELIHVILCEECGSVVLKLDHHRRRCLIESKEN